MALIKCSECGKEISDQSKQCVGCGAPVKLAEEKTAGIPSANDVKNALTNLTSDKTNYLALMFDADRKTFLQTVNDINSVNRSILACYTRIPQDININDVKIVELYYKKILYGYYIYLDVKSTYQIEDNYEPSETIEYYIEILKRLKSPTIVAGTQNTKTSSSTSRTIVMLLLLGVFLYVAYNYFGGARMLACGTRDVYYLKMMPEYKGCKGGCSVIGKEINLFGEKMCMFKSKESVE